MGSKKADVLFSSTPLFAYEDRLPSSSELWFSQSAMPDFSFSHGWLTPESFRHSHSGGNMHMTLPIDHALGQDTSPRRRSVLLDIPSPTFVSPCATSESQFPLLDIGSVASAGGFNGFPASGHMLAPDTAPKPQVILHAQPASGLGLGAAFSSMTYHHANIDLDHPRFPTGNAPALASLGYTQNVIKFINNERQPPVMVYRPPEKSGSGRRCSRRACAINIEGLWIDKDDLYSRAGAGHDSNMISVYECRWAMSSNPCGMWIIGSRSRVGAHIRKWHTRQRHGNSRAKCLWDGCTRAMLKDSINRHIVTVHLGESFHCLGCNQEFPRSDVYNQHVEDSRACRDVGAAMVYGAEPRVIDVHQALHQGAAIRYACR